MTVSAIHEEPAGSLKKDLTIPGLKDHFHKPWTISSYKRSSAGTV